MNKKKKLCIIYSIGLALYLLYLLNNREPLCSTEDEKFFFCTSLGLFFPFPVIVNPIGESCGGTY